MSKKITVRDIAKKTGLSPATISRVLNHPEKVKADTVEIVRNAMKNEGYDPAKKGAFGKPIILFNYIDTNNPFYSPIIEGAITSARARNYYMLTSHDTITEEKLEDYISMLKTFKVQGLMVADHIDEKLLLKINKIIPVVQCCEFDPDTSLPFVGIDDIAASYQALNHILSTGHTNIAFVNGPIQYQYAQKRKEGYLSFMRSHGLNIQPGWSIDLPHIDFKIAYTIVSRLLSDENRPDAIYASSDVIAAAAIVAAHDLGISVPDDLVIVGFDNITISIMTSPSITTVSQPAYQIGFTALEQLINRIENPKSPVTNSILPTELIVRASSQKQMF